MGSTVDSTPYLAPCVNEDAQVHFRRTVLENISRDLYSQYTDKEYGDELYLWGVREGNVRYWKQIERGDVLLFYTESGLYTHAARVRDTQYNPEFGEAVYTEADDPFYHLMYLEPPFEVDIPSAEFHRLIGYGRDFPINFTIVGDDRLEDIEDQFGSFRQYLREKRREGPNAPEDDVQQASEELETQTSQEPSLTEDDTSYTTQTRKARSAAFRRKVHQVYGGQCAVCGVRRESPQGTTEVEAAHIYPRSENGSDDIRNGLALCKLHHWALDSGWMAINNNYELLVADEPGLDGYEEFVAYEDEELRLPDEQRLKPHPKFVEAHRELHGFSHY
jgi:putative restriction endonuclease